MPIACPSSCAGPDEWNPDEGNQIHLDNLDDDLGETKNLAPSMPERVAKMKELLETLIVNGRSTPGAPQTNDVGVRRFPKTDTPRSRRHQQS